MFVCLLLHYGKTAEWIWLKFCMHIIWSLDLTDMPLFIVENARIPWDNKKTEFHATKVTGLPSLNIINVIYIYRT